MNMKNFMFALFVSALFFLHPALGFPFEKIASSQFSGAISLKNVAADFSRMEPFFDLKSAAQWAEQNPAIASPPYAGNETEMILAGQMAGYFGASTLLLRTFARYGGYALSEPELSFRAGKLAQLSLYWVRDWRQTLVIGRHPDYYEMNPIIGRNPSDIEIHAYFLGGIVLLHYLAVVLPDILIDSIIDSIRMAEDMVTRNNVLLFEGRKISSLPVALVVTVRF